MDETIEVLGCVAKQTGGGGYQVRTPLGLVLILRLPGEPWWSALWVPRGARRMVLTLLGDHRTPADAAREATRRLRAIQRTCARAAAREEA